MKNARVLQAASVSGLLLIMGCLSSENRRSVCVDRPANPPAREAPCSSGPNLPAEPVSSTLANTPAQREGKIYTCPMHPEVRESSPGRCPKCGMTLESVVPAEKHGGDHVHGEDNGQ